MGPLSIYSVVRVCKKGFGCALAECITMLEEPVCVCVCVCIHVCVCVSECIHVCVYMCGVCVCVLCE